MQTDTSNSNLISSDRVNGTDVYGTSGDKVGHIDHLMIDRQSGSIAFAVMGFGGFLGMGEDHHPVPWSSLRYDTTRQGYVTDISEAQLQSAPARNDDWQDDPVYRDRLYSHYGAPSYWL